MLYWNVYKNDYINSFVYGDELTPMESVCTFITKYKTEKEAKEACEELNKQVYCMKKDLQKTEKKLIEKITNSLVSGTVPEPSKDSEAPKLLIKSPKSFDWKEAMKALIDGKRVEARVCIPGLPESENGWFEVEFAIGPDDKEFGESVKFGKDWDYRIKDDSKEREELFDECEKLGIINVSKASKISTPLLHDIVDAIKSIDLDWEGIAKQINEETK